MRTALLSLAILTVLFSGIANARIDTIFCEPRETLHEILQTEYGAEMTGQGVRGPDIVLEIWSTPDGADWTLVQSYANGQACVVAMGQHWEARDRGRS